MDMNEVYVTFLNESRDLLEEMEAALLRMESEPDDVDLVNAVFRAAHTIKGSGGVFGFDSVVAFTHRVESVLDRVRNGELALDSDLLALMLNCRDHMAELVEAAVAGEELDAATETAGVRLSELLESWLLPRPSVQDIPAPRTESVGSGCAVASDCWHVSIRFDKDILKAGLDPLALLRFLSKIGELVHVEPLFDDMPELAELDPEVCHLGLEIDIRTDADRKTIEEAFEFFQDDATIHIVPPRADVEAWLALIDALPEEELRIGEILVRSGALTQEELERVLDRQQSETQPQRRPVGEMLSESGAVPQPVVEAAADKQQRARREPARNSSIRVDADKLDTLINLVGELVIAGATTGLLAQRRGDEELMESNSVMSRLVEEIRDSALRLRMVQIADTFNRFNRVVRDVSREIHKDIRLEISGGETELDKTVVEKIGDPLMHLVRNSMDHGIEDAEARLAAGKPEHGTVRLNAYHDSGSIVIEVSDDGKGLDADPILAKAQEKELVAPNQHLSDQEIYRLIFEPGFSTAEQVTNLSGRGVGMDVVRRNIEALRGTVDVNTKPGEGTTFSIRLPLTLAIIDGFLVGVGESQYVIPLDMVIECIEVTDEERQEHIDAHYINLRGEVLPFLRLHDLFGERPTENGRENIVVVQYAGQKAGMVVDELLGEFQTVIKPLGKVFRNLKGVSGATILGSGEVAVILDVPQLVQTAATQANSRAAA